MNFFRNIVLSLFLCLCCSGQQSDPENAVQPVDTAQNAVAPIPVDPIPVDPIPVDPIAVNPLFGAAVPAGDYVPLTGKQRYLLFLRQTFTTPNPWLRTSISTAVADLQGRQHSWGGGVQGYGKRYASQYATYVIRNSFLSLGAWGLGHDTRYVPSPSHKVSSRIVHAVLQNILTKNHDGNTTLNISRIASGYGAGMIATSWQPNSKWSAQGLRAGNEQMMYGAIFNVGREFASEVGRLMRRLRRV